MAPELPKSGSEISEQSRRAPSERSAEKFGIPYSAAQLSPGQTNSRTELARDVSVMGKPSAVLAPEQTKVAAKNLVSRIEAARTSTHRESFDEHLRAVTLLLKESATSSPDLEEEFERLTGKPLRTSLFALSVGPLSESLPQRRDSIREALLEIGARAQGKASLSAKRKAAWAEVLFEEYLAAKHASPSKSEGESGVADLERALLALRLARLRDATEPHIIEVFVEIQKITGRDILSELHKSHTPQELSLIHALLLESEPRIEALQFLRRLEKADSLGDLVAFFPATHDFDKFEREVSELTGATVTDLLMAKSLTLKGEGAVKDDELFQAELTIVQAAFSAEARRQVYDDKLVSLVERKAEQLRAASYETLDRPVLSAQESQLREAAAKSGMLKILHKHLSALDLGTIQTDEFNPELLASHAGTREASEHLKAISLSSGVKLDPAFVLRNSEEFSRLSRLSRQVSEQASAAFESDVNKIPDGYLKEQFLLAATEALLESEVPLSEAVQRLHQTFEARVQEIALASASKELLELKAALQGAESLSTPERYALAARIHTLPPDLLKAFEAHVDATGVALSKQLEVLGGTELQTFAEATKNHRPNICSAIVVQQLITSAQRSDALKLLSSMDAQTRAAVVLAYEERYQKKLLSELTRKESSPQEISHAKLLLGSPEETHAESAIESALGLTGESVDLVVLNEALRQIAPDQRLALFRKLGLPEKRSEIMGRIAEVAKGDTALAELAISLLENGPQPKNQIEEAAAFLRQRAQSEALRKEAEELLEKRLEQNRKLRRGAELNQASALAPIEEQDALTRGWCWVTGVTSAANRDAENSRLLASEYKAQEQQILLAREEVKAAAKRAKEEEDAVLAALAFGRQQAALDAAQRANKSLVSMAEIMNSPRSKSMPDLTRYQSETKAVMKDLDSSLSSIDHWETGLKVTRTAVIVVGGAAVVVATGGAALPAWQAALLVTAAATPGTIVQGTLDVHYGNKDVKTAVIDSALQVGSDFLGAYGGNQIGKGLAQLAGKGLTPRDFFKVKQILSDFRCMGPDGKMIILKRGLTISEKALEQLLKGSNLVPMTKTFIPALSSAGSSTGIAALLSSGAMNLRKEIVVLVNPGDKKNKKVAEVSPSQTPARRVSPPTEVEGSDEKKNKENKRAPKPQSTNLPPQDPSPGVSGVATGSTPPVNPPPPPGPGKDDPAQPGTPSVAVSLEKPEPRDPPAPPPERPGNTPVSSSASRPQSNKESAVTAREPEFEDFRRPPHTNSLQPQQPNALGAQGNSYTAHAPNNILQSPPLESVTMTTPQSELGRDTLQRKIAETEKERELERVRFFRGQEAAALEQVQVAVLAQRRWMEELQAEVLRQYAQVALKQNVPLRAKSLAQARAAGAQNSLAQEMPSALAASRTELQQSLAARTEPIRHPASARLSDRHAERLSAEATRAHLHFLGTPEKASNALASPELMQAEARAMSELQLKPEQKAPLTGEGLRKESTHEIAVARAAEATSALAASSTRTRRAMLEQSHVASLNRVDASQKTIESEQNPYALLRGKTFAPTARPLAIEVARSVERVSHQIYMSGAEATQRIPLEVRILLTELRRDHAAQQQWAQQQGTQNYLPTQALTSVAAVPVTSASATAGADSARIIALREELKVAAARSDLAAALQVQTLRIQEEEEREQQREAEEREDSARANARQKRLKRKKAARQKAELAARRLMIQIAEEALKAEEEEELDEKVEGAVRTLKIPRRKALIKGQVTPAQSPPSRSGRSVPIHRRAHGLPQKPAAQPSSSPHAPELRVSVNKISRAELYRKHRKEVT